MLRESADSCCARDFAPARQRCHTITLCLRDARTFVADADAALMRGVRNASILFTRFAYGDAATPPADAAERRFAARHFDTPAATLCYAFHCR